jgi:hypothetical protein
MQHRGKMLIWKLCSILALCWMAPAGAQEEECVEGDENNSVKHGGKAAECVDTSPECPLWANNGECDYNPKYMLKSCQRTCEACHLSSPELNQLIDRRIRIQQVGGDERFLETPYGMSQSVSEEMEDGIIELFRNMAVYMDDVVENDLKYDTVRDRCKNKHRECTKWKFEGECATVSI